MCLWTSKSFSTDTLGVNFEVLNLHLYMDYCEFALSDEAKGFSWLPGDKFLNFILFFWKLDLSVFVDLEMIEQRGFHDSQEIDSLILFLFLCLTELNV